METNETPTVGVMEAPPLPTPDQSDWTERFQAALKLQREQVDHFLAANEERFEQAEADLLEQLAQLAEELARGRQETVEARQEVDQRAKTIEGQQEQLEQLREQLDARQAEWQRLDEAALQRHQEALAALKQEHEKLEAQRQALLERDTAELEKTQAELIASQRQCEQLDAQLATLQRELDEARQRCAERDEQVHQLREELAAEQARLREQRHRADETEQQAQSRCAEAQSRYAEAQSRYAEVQSRYAEAESRCTELEGELENLRARCRELESQAVEAAERDGPDTGTVDAGQFEELHRERDTLIARAADLELELEKVQRELQNARDELERRPDEGGASDSSDSSDTSEADDYRRRYEIAMDDVRELRAENEQLKERLERKAAGGGASSSGGSGGAPASSGSGVLDWEAEKQRILAALEADSEEDDEDDEEARRQRLKIEEVVERTDRIVAQKNREIEELQRLLEDQSSSVGAMAVGASAFGEMLDKDEIIREERENLARLQEEWREKLRQAEVEISVERAKIARERTQLDEKLQMLQKQDPGSERSAEATDNPTGKPTRGRWLAQLGLKGQDDDAEATD